MLAFVQSGSGQQLWRENFVVGLYVIFFLRATWSSNSMKRFKEAERQCFSVQTVP
jgi:hypothetical protein